MAPNRNSQACNLPPKFLPGFLSLDSPLHFLGFRYLSIPNTRPYPRFLSSFPPAGPGHPALTYGPL